MYRTGRTIHRLVLPYTVMSDLFHLLTRNSRYHSIFVIRWRICSSIAVLITIRRLRAERFSSAVLYITASILYSFKFRCKGTNKYWNLKIFSDKNALISNFSTFSAPYVSVSLRSRAGWRGKLRGFSPECKKSDSHHCEPLMRDYSWLCPHKKSAFTTLSFRRRDSDPVSCVPRPSDRTTPR